MITAIALFVILFAFGMMYPNSRKVAFAILLYMWIFYSFNTYSGDYEVYRTFYEEVDTAYLFAHFEPGFAFIMHICRSLSFSFLGFKIVLGTLYILLLHFVIRTYTKREAMVLALFMVFPFMLFTSVLRAGVAMLIIALSFKYLSSTRRWSFLRYATCIIAATLFHYSSIVFILLFLLRRYSFKKVFLWSLAIVVVVSALFFSGLLYRLASMVIKNGDILEWLDYASATKYLNIRGQLGQIVILLLTIVMMYLARESLRIFVNKKRGVVHISRKEIRLVEMVFKSNLLLIIFIPLFMVSDAWLRMVWALFLINIIVYVIVLSKRIFRVENKKIIKNSSLVLMGSAAFLILCVAYTNLPYMNTPISVENYFVNNVVFQLFKF